MFWIPLAIAAASSVASNALHSSAANKVAKAQRAAELMEQTRQDAMRDKARQSFTELLANQGRAEQESQLADETAKLEDYYTSKVNPSSFMELLPGQGMASRTVKTDIVNEGNKGIQKALQSGKARAALEAYGGVGLNNDLKYRDTTLNLNNISDESRGSARILPLELQAAQNKGATQRGFANLLGMVSSVAGSAAAGQFMNAAMTPGALGGESAVANIGSNLKMTPSFDLYTTVPATGYGPILPTKVGWGDALSKVRF